MMEKTQYKEFGWSEQSSIPYFNDIFKYIIDLLPRDGSPILDIGCGNGFMDNVLISMGFNIYGIDASEQGVALANRNYPNHFFVKDITSSELPQELKDIPFKTIISTEVIEHLYSPASFTAFVKSILVANGGGTFILTTPYYGYLKNIVLALFNKMDHSFSALWEGGHIKFWSRKTITILLQNAGFRNIKFKGTGRCHFIWRHMIIKGEI